MRIKTYTSIICFWKGDRMINIAIDGHVASGKSTVAHEVAERLGFKVLDTGAIYRGLACAYKEGGFGEINQSNIENFISKTSVKVEFISGKQHVFVNDKDYTAWLRLEETSRLSSQISPFPILREKVMQIQRTFANENDCVVEGRDIGSEVLPNAQVKFFITASEEVRAKRRFDQLQEKSQTAYQQILEDLRARDYKDEHREVAPLRIVEDSIVIDTSNLTLDETINKCIELIKQRVKI